VQTLLQNRVDIEFLFLEIFFNLLKPFFVVIADVTIFKECSQKLEVGGENIGESEQF
jgi:hypothetical protein